MLKTNIYLTLLLEFRCFHLVYVSAVQVFINLLGVIHPLHGIRTLDLIQLLQMYVHASIEGRHYEGRITHLFR